MTCAEHRDKATTTQKKMLNLELKNCSAPRSCGLAAINPQKCFFDERSLFP